MSVEVRDVRWAMPGRRGGSYPNCGAVYVDGVFYASFSKAEDERDVGELLRTAERWRKSEHGDFLVLRDAAPGGRGGG